MKHRIYQYLKRKFSKKPVIAKEVVPSEENFCLIQNIEPEVNFVLTTWVNKNHAWTQVVQKRFNNVLTTQFNHHDVPNCRASNLGVRFVLAANNLDVRPIQTLSNNKSIMVSATSFSVL